MGFVQRQLVKVVLGVVKWPRLTVAICAVLLLVAISLTYFRLTISTDQNALLTPNLQFFKDYLAFDRKFPENEAFVVLVEAKDYEEPPEAKRWMGLADGIRGALLELKGVVRRVDAKVPLEELGGQALLFEEDFESVKGQTAEMMRMAPLVEIMVGEPRGMNLLGQRMFGPNMTARFFGAVGGGPKEEGMDFGLYITRSLNAALRSDPALRGGGEARIEKPDLTDLDPRAKYDAYSYGYPMIVDETKRWDPQRRHEKIMAISVYGERDFTSMADVTEPLRKMREVVGKVAAEYPEFLVEFTGRPVLEADEMATSDRDIRLAEILGLSLIFIMLWFFLRNFWLVAVAAICLGVAIGWTFGWATLSVGRLNLLSMVFVIAMIGIGMDYFIQILSRYRVERCKYVGVPQKTVWVRVYRFVSIPILTTCLGASGAFFVASLTDFTGAAELGVIAGGGLLLCFVAGYTLLPALLTIWPGSLITAEVAENAESVFSYKNSAPSALSAVDFQVPKRWWWVVPGVWVLVAVGGVMVVGMPHFDPNLLKLQSANLASVKLVHKLPTWSAVVLTDDLEKLRAAREKLEAPPPGSQEPEVGSTIRGTSSILNAIDTQAWLAKNNAAVAGLKWKEPGGVRDEDLGVIARMAEMMVDKWNNEIRITNDESNSNVRNSNDETAELRAEVKLLTERLRAGGEEVRLRLEAWQRGFYCELRGKVGMFTPGLLDLARVPAEVRDHFVSYRDETGQVVGRPTYALYIYPREDLWEQGRLAAFVEEVEARVPKDVVLTGIAVQLLHSTQAIHRAFLMSTLYAIVLIFLLVLVDLRKLGDTFLAVSVLGLGIPMLIVLMALWRWMGDPWGIPGTWNFANFFGLPILIGAGHEYGVFLVHRYREALADRRRGWVGWDVADKALLLCAIVTSSSFGFLMLAQHRGLASLGWVMAVGSACIYLAGLLVLRPVLRWRLGRK